jgi:hypothetical protein
MAPASRPPPLAVVCATAAAALVGMLPPASHAAVASGAAIFSRGDAVMLAPDVTVWPGSLRSGEIGQVAEAGIASETGEGFWRYLVRRSADDSRAWYEEDELVRAVGTFSSALSSSSSQQPPPPPQPQRIDSGRRDCTRYESIQPVAVLASSAQELASKLVRRSGAGTTLKGVIISCERGAVSFSGPLWLPDNRAEVGWLEAQFGTRYHVKEVTIHKLFPAGLVRMVEGIEPRFHGGYKVRAFWNGRDTTGCGAMVVNIPSVTPYSVDKVRVSTAADSQWSWDDERLGSAAQQQSLGIAGIELLGIPDECYAKFTGESEQQTLLRRRMENGYTGCTFSSKPLLDAAKRHRAQKLTAPSGSCSAPSPPM